MGPDFSTDIIEVETSDHTRLRMQLSYNWYFRQDGEKEDDKNKMFEVRDFIGDLCN